MTSTGSTTGRHRRRVAGRSDRAGLQAGVGASVHGGDPAGVDRVDGVRPAERARAVRAGEGASDPGHVVGAALSDDEVGQVIASCREAGDWQGLTAVLLCAVCGLRANEAGQVTRTPFSGHSGVGWRRSGAGWEACAGAVAGCGDGRLPAGRVLADGWETFQAVRADQVSHHAGGRSAVCGCAVTSCGIGM